MATSSSGVLTTRAVGDGDMGRNTYGHYTVTARCAMV